MKTEENTEKKLYTPPDFYVVDFNKTLSGPEEADDESEWGNNPDFSME